MIIHRRASPEGALYHVARASERFPQHVHALVRDARAQGLPLAMPGRDDAGVLVVGPLGLEEEWRFRARWGDFLADAPP